MNGSKNPGRSVATVVRSYGDDFKHAVVVDAHYRASTITLEFPYRLEGNATVFDPPLEAMKEPLAAALADWSKQTKPRLFDLF